ncbi:chemotaxis protein MotB [Rhodopseudomonas thermotolerans]|jgi:chemotaxis protein MotB|uniref:Chemotaxis protein MotB n=2 Tax=Rhodopseudomonas TaxID=1073 RepID=A0A336JLS2_9BRAD|nr:MULTISPECIES: flagellar motor protein MotB [Rhodopseudomonas]RED42368.1 chemotaxis protein MotB [Rhodopseudomonas pentothenatexigens]REG08158.1 chemotaxis protein MotB [Rhodopseudomonas thermotolerans]SSW88969.1 chemotaxis protein MotB [Rhodopseudomonas pentothenatexigens]
MKGGGGRLASGSKKKVEEEHQAHGWFVTFADLMGLLVSFFVMLVSFSTQDLHKMQIIAGSMREAFGVQQNSRFAGILETDGVPVQGHVKSKRNVAPDQASNTPHLEEAGGSGSAASHAKAEREFALASASLRQALQDVPELAEMSKNVMFDETPAGLNLELTDQDGRPMFPDGSAVPYERTRKLVARLAAPLRATSLRISIVGHTAATVMRNGDVDPLSLSVDRASAVHEILKQEGLPTSQVLSLIGKGDGDPLLPDAPMLSANRRVTIMLMRENPPLPPDLQR